MWCHISARVASFGLGICQTILPNAYFRYLFQKYLCRIPMPKLATLVKIVLSLLHFMFWFGNPWMSRNIFEVCVNILIYISQFLQKSSRWSRAQSFNYLLQWNPVIHQYIFNMKVMLPKGLSQHRKICYNRAISLN